jgi:hypothetical protein
MLSSGPVDRRTTRRRNHPGALASQTIRRDSLLLRGRRSDTRLHIQSMDEMPLLPRARSTVRAAILSSRNKAEISAVLALKQSLIKQCFVHLYYK